MSGSGDQVGRDLVGAAGDALMPGAGVLSKWFLRHVGEEHTRRHSLALRAAEQQTGLTREQLAEVIASNPQLISMHTRLLYAAGVNGHDQLLRAMGLVLGDAINALHKADELEIVLTSIQDLNPVHVAVLQKLAEEAPPFDSAHSSALITADDQAVEREWSYDSLRNAFPEETRRLASLGLLALMSRGLAYQVDVFTGTGYRISELGMTLLDVVDALPDKT